ncbi:flavin-dependent dehydrogenase [Tumebacillus sp. BK434]|uniref:NAD(P)/FAD-dependent oxidoreductase n=1 Tax=Tumebacillus sp. BK434 TaxID=2512169 RepID=UPI00104CA2C3|nr:tryptophan 7-halogenase [Tumebacillus sp. BK434]TCP52149.1 flavin-dependent dehydrogenase [Tumebacillus sp. BK434]
MERVQIAILGGGTAGSAAAYLLSRAGVSTQVLDRPQQPGWKIGEGLPPSSSALFRRLGLWEHFLADGHLPSYGNRSAWGAEQFAEQHFIFDPNGHGWHVDREKLDMMLAESARLQGSRRVAINGLHEVRKTEAGWELGTADGQQLAAEWVIDASGRSSHFASRQNVRRTAYDQLVAVAGLYTAPHDEDQDSMTMIEAVEGGWWYTALLPGRKRVFAYLSDGDLPVTKAVREEAAWQQLLLEGTQIGRLVQQHRYRLTVSPRMVSANSSALSTAVGDRWLAIGDAAAAYDPLSSQGILMALGTATEASEALLAHFRGDPSALSAYAGFLSGMYQEYLSARDHYYAMETRFPHAPFWQRRQQAKRLDP